MAIVIPMRSKYKPRDVVEYVVDNIMRLRSNCDTITHPNTPLQQSFKNRFTLIHELQRGITPLFARGFNRRKSCKDRWVGAFHVAQGHNMTEATQQQEDGITWRVNFSRFTICEHKSKAPKRITVQRKGHILVMHYVWKGQAERTSILWAIYNKKRGAWVHGIHDTRLHGKVTACAIPPAWKEEPVEVLIGFGKDAEGRGKLRGTHHFAFEESEGIITVRGTPSHATHTTGTIPPWRVVTQGSAPWVEVIDNQGVTLRIEVFYWLE